MKQLTLALLVFMAAASVFAKDTKNEKLVKAYYSGYENHDWNTVVAQLADGFTSTSPNNDNHIPLDKFKEKCWPTNKFCKKVSFIKMVESGDDVLLLVEINTTDNKVVRNVDYYKFKDGKIKSIEVFFGAGAKYPGNKG